MERVQMLILAFILSSARAATAPASLAVLARNEGVKVSVYVTSHIRSFPLSHGTRVIPSGRLPSD